MDKPTTKQMDLDAERVNARVRRSVEINDLERNTGLIRSEAASLVDAGGPSCSKCGETVPRDQVAEHVRAHVEGA